MGGQKYEYNGFKEIGVNTKNWVGSAQDRDYQRALVNVQIKLWIP